MQQTANAVAQVGDGMCKVRPCADGLRLSNQPRFCFRTAQSPGSEPALMGYAVEFERAAVPSSVEKIRHQKTLQAGSRVVCELESPDPIAQPPEKQAHVSHYT